MRVRSRIGGRESGSVKLVRRASEAPTTIRTLMESLQRRVAEPFGVFVGAACETRPRTKSIWRGLVLAYSDPTEGRPPARDLIEIMGDDRFLGLLLYDPANARAPSDLWHLRIKDAGRSSELFLAPWVEALSNVLASTPGAGQVRTHIDDGRFYATVAAPEFEKFFDLSTKEWWSQLPAAAAAAGGDALAAVASASGRDLFTGTTFLRRDARDRILRGALRRHVEGVIRASERPAVSLFRSEPTSDDSVSFEVRCEPEPALRRYLSSLARGLRESPLSDAEEANLQTELFSRLGFATGPREKYGVTLQRDVAIVVDELDPHLLLSFIGPVIGPSFEFPRTKSRDCLGTAKSSLGELAASASLAADMLSLPERAVSNLARSFVKFASDEARRVASVEVDAFALPRSRLADVRGLGRGAPEDAVDGV